MRNILLIIALALSSSSFAIPGAFTELFTYGMWAGEAKQYNNDGSVRQQFFYAAEISEDGKTFNTLTPPGRDPEARFQRYSLKEAGLGYALKNSAEGGTLTGTLTGFASENNTWVFSSERFIHKYTKISDTEILIETYFGNNKHAEINLTYQGTGWLGLMSVVKTMAFYK